MVFTCKPDGSGHTFVGSIDEVGFFDSPGSAFRWNGHRWTFNLFGHRGFAIVVCPD